MDGSLGFDDVELTIMSTHAIGSNSFVWLKEGDVLIVESDQEVIFYFKMCSKFVILLACHELYLVSDQ